MLLVIQVDGQVAGGIVDTVGGVFTQPADLTEEALTDVLNEQWRFTATELEYQAVGFGSHHWLATNAEGVRLFATVDDLTAKLRTADDTTDAAFGRLGRAFATALSLATGAGLAFVLAPLPASDGQVLVRLADRYSLVIHPYVTGTQAGLDGEFTSVSDRRTVLDMLSQLHRAHATMPLADDFVVPHMDALRPMLSEPGRAWERGPYAERAHDLLCAHVTDLEVLVATYDELARRVASRQNRLVITHGEPQVAGPPGKAVMRRRSPPSRSRGAAVPPPRDAAGYGPVPLDVSRRGW